MVYLGQNPRVSMGVLADAFHEVEEERRAVSQVILHPDDFKYARGTEFVRDGRTLWGALLVSDSTVRRGLCASARR